MSAAVLSMPLGAGMEEELGIKEDDIEGLKLKYITLRFTKGEIRQNYYFFAYLHFYYNLLINSS